MKNLLTLLICFVLKGAKGLLAQLVTRAEFCKFNMLGNRLIILRS